MRENRLKQNISGFFLNYSIWALLAAIVIITTVFAPGFLSKANLISMLNEAVVVGIIAVGMTYVIISDCFDLSSGAIMGICCVIAMRIGPHDFGSTALSLLVPIVLGALIGAVDGFIVGYLDLNGFIATLGMQYVVLGATLIYTQGTYTTLAQYTTNYDNLYCRLGTASVGGIPLQVLIMIVLAVIAQLVLSYTNFGQYIRVSGENKQAATLSGVKVESVRLRCYVILGVCAAIAGLVLGSWVRQFEPQTGIGYEFEAITAVVLGGTSLAGGKGNIFNSIAGALIMVMIVNAMIMLDFSYNYQLMIRGLVLIIAVTVQVYTRRKDA